jgi:hypothetical protein
MSTTPDKPSRVSWATISRVADEANDEHFEPPSEEELTRQLREAGFADDAADRLLDRALAADDAKASGRPRRSWVPFLAAAALLLLFLLAWKRREVVAWIEGQPVEIGPDRPGPERELTPVERAARVRRDAFAACDAKQWDKCGAELDWAKGLDPAGETAERVVAARAAMATATGGGDGGPPPKAPR